VSPDLRRDLRVPLASKLIAHGQPSATHILARAQQFFLARFDLEFAFL
jgi:hypothetical protein